MTGQYKDTYMHSLVDEPTDTANNTRMSGLCPAPH